MKLPNFLKPIISNIKNVDVWGERNFRRDWKVISVTGFIIVVIAFIFIWRSSSSVVGNLINIKANSRSVLTINRSAMDKLVNLYKNQEKSFKEIRSATIIIPDPSK